MKTSMHRLALALATLTLATAAQAHGIWFAQRADRLALVYGDGAEDLDVVKRLPRITSVAGMDFAGKPLPAGLQPEGRLAFVNLEAGPDVVTATMDNGLWSKDAVGQWHGRGLDDIRDATVSGRYLKYATHLVRLPAGALPPAPGLALQIVPASARFPRHKDEALTVQVLFNGQPLPRARVWTDMVNDPDGTPLVADAQGKVTLKVRNQGLNVLKAEHEGAPSDPARARMTHHLATLSFMLEHAPE
jgi:nickel transport protein